MNWKEEAVRLIEAQQRELDKEEAARVVGEQLKELCRAEAESARLVAEDLGKEAMSLRAAEKKLQAYADGKHAGTKKSCVAVTGEEAEKVLREFYGLPERGAAAMDAGEIQDLDLFL